MVQRASRAEGYPRPLSTPPAIALLRSAFAFRRRIWGWVEGVRGKRRTRQTHLAYLVPENGQGFRGGAEYLKIFRLGGGGMREGAWQGSHLRRRCCPHL
jgi:hypothetical protein